jgi:GTP-binding protein HflX
MEPTPTGGTPNKACLVSVQLPDVDDAEAEDSLAELGRLAKTLGLEVTARLTQRRASFDPGTYFGSGKLDELKIVIDGGTADTILVDHEISPSQARNLEKATGAVVMDRTAVILEIFHRHARSRAAKAQVEIVRLLYMAPRMREQGKGKDRQRGAM